MQRELPVEFDYRSGDGPALIFPLRVARTVPQGAVVLDDTLKRFPCQVEPVEPGIPALQAGYDAQRLRVVIKAAKVPHHIVQCALACMTKGRMAKIMRKGNGFRQVKIETEHARDGAGNLRHLDRMGQTRAVVIAFMEDEYLCLELQPPESG